MALKISPLKKIKPIPTLIVLHVLVVLLALILIFRGEGENPFEENEIAVVPIQGVISMEPGSLSYGQTISSLVKTFSNLEEDKNTRAIVLRINSPGGSVGATQEIYRSLMKLRRKGKIIVSSFGEVSASGGYYIACAGNKIVLNPGTLTGSIGVVMQLPNLQGLLTKVGVSMRTIKSGALKDSGSPFRAMSSGERRYFRKIIMDAYAQFFEAVKKGRHFEDAQLKKLADGRIFSGRMAIQNKLADELGGLEEAIELAKKLSGLEDTKPKIVTYKGKVRLARLLGMFSKSPLEKITDLENTQMKILYMMQ